MSKGGGGCGERGRLFLLLGLLLLMRPLTAVEQEGDDRITLHVGGIFPMEAGAGGWAGGQACLPAVKLALKDLNDRHDILSGYRLHLNDSNSKCQPGLATQQLYELLYTPPVKLMLLAGCSPVTTVIAEVAPVWKLVVVFTSTAKDLEREAKLKGIRTERQSFYGDPTDAIRTIVRQDARIIVGLFYVTEARRVICQAYKAGLYGRKYVWFFIGWYADTWFLPPAEENLNCTAEQDATNLGVNLAVE